MSVFDKILGGSKQSSSSTSESTSSSRQGSVSDSVSGSVSGSGSISSSGIDPNLLKFLMPLLEQSFPLTGSSPDDVVAGLTPEEIIGQNKALGYADNVDPLISNITDTFKNLLGSKGDIEKLLPGATDTILSAFSPGGGSGYTPDIPDDTLKRLMSGEVNLAPFDAVADAALSRLNERFNEDVLPNITHSNQLSTPFGSSRGDIAKGVASGKLLDTQGDILANIYGDAFKQAQDLSATGTGLALEGEKIGLDSSKLGELARQFNIGTAGGVFDDLTGINSQISNALGLSGDISSLGLLPSEIYRDVGGENRGIEQDRLDVPFDLAKFYRDIIGPLISSSDSVSSSYGTSGSKSSGASYGVSDSKSTSSSYGTGKSSGGLKDLFSFTKTL